ncbi:nitrous oxide reductase accessory protein NosL [Sphingomonas naasensis]|uniref:DUF4398 domain-containing protein n=1 Tax=Sphingomonas naasensis TaxID=1344951 RepID=A0A4S1WTW4_9SPHN|nr:hypothetical protein [Sphingomonas naasensis]NIJ18492.1 nitrous oxide reductase accessory protein NosL [Sphingomonas naasensis]TGX45747.1 hypothetical protein E5A74_00765 [Sphingomonas naasensis]
MRSSLFAALPALAPLVLIALAGCTQSPDAYPSLLPRPIEKQSLAEPERVAAVPVPDPALDSRIAALSTPLAANSQKFAAAAQDAEAKIAVARGVAEGSDAWLDAQTALSTIESLRAPTLNALAQLEEIAIERGKAGEPPYPALDAVIAEADGMAKAQDMRIAALKAALGGE